MKSKKLNTAAQQRIARAEKNNLCVACMTELGGTARTIRGCHEYCYRASLRAVEAGTVTMVELESTGRILPAQRGGRKPSLAVTIEARNKK